MTTIPAIPITVGIDIGSESTKVVLGTQFACEIVRSDAGLHTTPTAVSFTNKQRQTGENSNQKGKNSVIELNRLLYLNNDNRNEEFLEGFYTFAYHMAANTSDSPTGTTNVTVDYNGEQRTFSATAVLAMLLSGVNKSVKTTIERLNSSSSSIPTENIIHYVFSVTPGTPASVAEQLLDAAFVAGLGDHVNIVETSTAYASAFQRKFPEFQQGKTVLIIDMGHSQTSVSVVRFGHEEKEREDEHVEGEGNEETNPSFTVLSSKCNHSLGAASVDIRLWHHFQSTLPGLKGVVKKSRAGHRLLQGAHKLKHLLSQLPEGSVTVENVGENDTDISLKGTRNTLVELCEEDVKSFQELVRAASKEAGVEMVDAVEVVGGGCRIPWVQAAIQEVLPVPDFTLSRSLDDTSAALGAALVAENDSNEELFFSFPEVDETTMQLRQILREEEQKMAALDMEENMKADIRNRVEAKVLELRSAKHGKHGGLLPKDTLEDYLNSLEDWLFSVEAEEATREAMETKLKDMEKQTQELCADYYSALEKEQQALEREIEEVAKQAQVENAANGGDDQEDHDNRRLPKKRRMEIVLKNKEEANELFKHGNWRFAAARYTKALSHCTKFVDLSPDDIQEVNNLQVALTLNLALAYMKMSNFDQALRVCNEALSLDDTSAKAYYRRASVYYEKKQWDNAKKDITVAKKLAESDKAIQKLGDRIDLQLKKQKQKEKKMASKMFG